MLTAVIKLNLSVASSALRGLPADPTGAIDSTDVVNPNLSVAINVIGAPPIGNLPSAVVSAINSIIPLLENAVTDLPTSLAGSVIPLPTAASVVSAIGSFPRAIISATDSRPLPLESAVARALTILPSTDGPVCSLVPAATVLGPLELVVSAVGAIIAPLPSAIKCILEPVPKLVQPAKVP